MNDIIVTSRRDINDVVKNQSYPFAIISITDNRSHYANITIADPLQCAGICRLRFGDVTTKEIATLSNTTLFCEKQAKMILNFVESIRDSIEVLIVQCDAGISRSAGVALALHRILQLHPEQITNNPRYFPNFFVVALLMRTAFNTHIIK